MVQKNQKHPGPLAGSAVERLEFHISYSCTNSCLFCSEADQLTAFRDRFVAKALILKRLQAERSKGVKHLTLTGGEPTLHPGFLDIVRRAKILGFVIYVSSNGGKFASSGFCRSTLPYIDEISFSLHGPDAKIHNAHTKNKKSYSLLMQALKNIENSRFSPRLFINSVATLQNINALERSLRTLSRFKKIKQVLISNIAPEGQARENFKQLAVPLARLRAKVRKLAGIAENNSSLIRFFGMPLCSLGSRPDTSNDLHWSPRKTLELWKDRNKTFLKETTTLAPDRNRNKIQKCRHCSYHDVCGGVFELYLKTFGDRDISPCS